MIDKRYTKPAVARLLEVTATSEGATEPKLRVHIHDLDRDSVHPTVMLDVKEMGLGTRRAALTYFEFRDFVRACAELCGLKIEES